MALNLANNFGFFEARRDHVISGVRTSNLPDPYGVRKGLVPTLVVGPQMKAKSDRPVKWATVIPPGADDLPSIDRPRGGDFDRIVGGSIIKNVDGEGKEQSFLVSHRDENAYYVLVRTGLKVAFGPNGSDGGMQDRLNIQKEHELVSHGSYSFDKASIRIATAENEAEIKELLDDPKRSLFTSVAAERMGVKVVGKSVALLGGRKCPQTSYVLWKMPIGAVLIVRDVDGKLTRLVSQKDQLRVVDASGYEKVFPMLEEAHEKARLAAREARKALQGQAAST
jgi:hypothetical protein